MSHDDPKVRSVVAAGAERGIRVDPVFFSTETRTAQDAASQVGCDVAQIVKTLVFMAGDEPVLFLVSGRNRLDPTKAARAAGVDRVDKADAAQAKNATGFSIGATPPFGHPRKIRFFMDEDLLGFDEVWAAAGRTDGVFPVNPNDLARAVDAGICPLKES